jgi:nucleoside diphosphate kinase
MSKFEKYTGKVVFEVKGEKFELTFLVKDRIMLASIYDNKDMKTRAMAMVEFCTEMITRAYPEEKKEDVEAFLVKNMEDFITQFMVAAGIIKKEDVLSVVETAKKAALQ